MQHQIHGNPEYGYLTVLLDAGDTFVAEAGAMSWMHDGMTMQSRLMGGLAPAIIRKLMGGESLFVAEYRHPTGGAVSFSPTTPGSVLHRELKGDTLILTGGSFLACTPGVQLKTKFGGFKALFSGEGAFYLECSGHGDLFFNAYGAVIEKQVQGSLIVDTGHVVAWEPTLSYAVQGMGSLKSTLLSGEGLVLKFTGSGKIYLQTRTLGGLSGWLTPFLRG